MYNFTCSNPSALLAKRHGILFTADGARRIGITIDGAAAWTNGYIAELGQPPKKLGPTTETKGELANIMRPVAPYTASPVAYFREEESQRDGTCIIATADLGRWEQCEARFVGYFLRNHKNVTFQLQEEMEKSVVVLSNGEYVGTLMPQTTGSTSPDFSAFLADYGLPTFKRQAAVDAKEGASSPMQYAAGATCPVTLAPVVVKPRIRVTLAQMRATTDNAEADALADAAVEAITGEEYAPAPIAPPAPIVRPAHAPTTLPAAIYAPAVGDTVFVVIRHTNGTTTDRVIDVTRVGTDVFRGHDRRYGRTRNFYAAQVAICRKWDGAAIFDHNGEEVVRAA